MVTLNQFADAIHAPRPEGSVVPPNVTVLVPAAPPPPPSDAEPSAVELSELESVDASMSPEDPLLDEPPPGAPDELAELALPDDPLATPELLELLLLDDEPSGVVASVHASHPLATKRIAVPTHRAVLDMGRGSHRTFHRDDGA